MYFGWTEKSEKAYAYFGTFAISSISIGGEKSCGMCTWKYATTVSDMQTEISVRYGWSYRCYVFFMLFAMKIWLTVLRDKY